jgi:hypothetical protein
VERQLIVERLKAKIDKAQEWHVRAKRHFDDLLKGTGLPHPDGTVAIRQAGRKYFRALHASQKARTDYTNFIAQDIVPDDLHSELDTE